MAGRKQKTEDVQQTISIVPIRTSRARVHLLGKTELVYHAMSQKARRELLYPKAKTYRGVDRLAAGLKHDPLEEYRDSFYKHMDHNQPTRLMFPAGAFKSALRNAALRLPGATKTEIGQLVWIEERDVSIYGVPQLWMTTVRMAGINKTPDIRTRPILPQWCCEMTVTFVESLLTLTNVMNLFAAAGMLMGVGDGRQEKGALNYGQFDVVNADDKRYQAVMREGGKAQQDAAIRVPTHYDDETAKLFAWFYEEVEKRKDVKKESPITGEAKSPKIKRGAKNASIQPSGSA